MGTQRRTISFKNLHELVKDTRLKSIERLLLIDLLLYAGTNGQAFPSHETLAKDMGCSTRWISSCLSMLFAQGWLKQWQRRGNGKSNLYNFKDELYFSTDKSNTNPSSSHKSTPVPNSTGTTPPPNVTHLNNSNSESVVNKSFKVIYPKDFIPSNNAESEALEAWKKLEPDKIQSFMPTYLGAVKKGLPADMFYKFASEIKQSPNVENKGKVFNSKVKEYLIKHSKRKGGDLRGTD